MRVEASVTSVSWIPSEAIAGITRLPFDLRVAHYDEPPPEHVDDFDELHRRGGFRFANELRAWAEVEDGRILRVGQEGRDLFSTTLVRLGTPRRPGRAVRQARGAERLDDAVADDPPRRVVAKAGTIDFADWYAGAFGTHSPWGGEQSAVTTTEAETPIERELAGRIMRRDRRPAVRRLAAGETLVEEGAPGTTVFLLLDGVLSVSVGGAELAQLGPGAVVGERALFEGGRRTAALRAATPCKVVEAAEEDLAPGVLRELSEGHRREDG